jgi:hypothetical protein
MLQKPGSSSGFPVCAASCVLILNTISIRALECGCARSRSQRVRGSHKAASEARRRFINRVDPSLVIRSAFRYRRRFLVLLISIAVFFLCYVRLTRRCYQGGSIMVRTIFRENTLG